MYIRVNFTTFKANIQIKKTYKVENQSLILLNINMIKRYIHDNKIIAIVIKNNYEEDGINFFTPDDFPQQIAYMSHKKNQIIKAHVHNIVERNISITQEVLILKKGKMRVDLYTDNKEYIESCILEKGDIIFLASGGHGIKCLEDIEMIEVKQGPYLKEDDKVRFQEIREEKVKINE